jgi:membrane carboxypeptidase/penicillin-binding protein
VRLRRTAEGGWHLAQIPEVQGRIRPLDPLDGAIVALNGGSTSSEQSTGR